MAFELPPLPYSLEALAPHISGETLDYHYNKHHKAYVDQLNTLTQGTEFAEMTLEDVVKNSDGAIFNNAAQNWNHSFFWNCLSPNSGQKPKGDLAGQIDKDFGSFEDFQKKFTEACVKQFGSGWGWLVKRPDGKLEVMSTSNADNPLKKHLTPILTCDVWEHAYYIDYRNKRPDFLQAFWNVTNWNLAEKNFHGKQTGF